MEVIWRPARRPFDGFFDDFHRADTALGSLGLPPSGQPAYTLRGAGGGTPLTVSQISGNRWVCAAGSIAYAGQLLAGGINSVSGAFSFTAGPGGASAMMGAVLMPIDPSPAGMFVDAVHLLIQQDRLNIQVMVAGVLTTVRAVMYDAPLPLDGARHEFSIWFHGDTVTYNVLGKIGTVTDPRFATLKGSMIFWEHFSTGADVPALYRWDGIWAN
jgi:hypothetical protein